MKVLPIISFVLGAMAIDPPSQDLEPVQEENRRLFGDLVAAVMPPNDDFCKLGCASKASDILQKLRTNL